MNKQKTRRKKQTPWQKFSCDFYKNFQDKNSKEQLWAAASVYKLKPEAQQLCNGIPDIENLFHKELPCVY